LFILRLSPVVPYSMLNPLCGLTRLPAFTYWWVSQVGMLPVLFVWVNAGAAVAEIRSARDLVSSELIVSLVLLATFPWLMYGLIWLARRWARR
ncbi:MAG TPA: VTT domain-containing protein, partial [Gemmataceae bacterium]